MTRRSMQAASHAQSCARKLKHPTRDAAMIALRKMVAAGAALPTLRAYRCSACRSWHLGNTTSTT